MLQMVFHEAIKIRDTLYQGRPFQGSGLSSASGVAPVYPGLPAQASDHYRG